MTPSEHEKMACPECGIQLSREQHVGIQLDACNECQGLWFDRGELEAYWKASGSSDGPPAVDAVRQESAPGRTVLACPRCKSETLVVGRVDVFNAGSCSACSGAWLGSVPNVREPRERAPDSGGGSGFMYDAVEIALDLTLRAIKKKQ